MLNAGIVSTDAKISAALHASLQQTGMVRSVVEWIAVGRAGWRLASGESVPDVVVLDLSIDPSLYFSFAAELRRLRPTVRIIACSALQELDSELLLQAMRTGVQDFLPRPVELAKLKETLQRFAQDPGEHAGTVLRDRVILVMGSKGGVGASTVAVNLAVQLAKTSGKQVGLLDLGHPLGHAGLLLDLRPQFSIRDAIENLERLDSHLLSGLVAQHKSGVSLLGGTAHADEWERLTPSAVSRLLNVSRSIFDSVVVDFGRAYTSEWKPVLSLARTILMVAQTNVPALWALERHLTDLAALGLDMECVRVVVNRWQRGDEEALQKFEKSTKRPIFARLPNDFAQASEASNLGVPLSKNHNDPLTTRYRQLASEFAGAAPVAGAKRGNLFNLFGKK